MTSSFANRINSLMERIEREKAIHTDGYMDGLSCSLFEMCAELAALDDLGVMLEADELEISQEAVRDMARGYARPLRC